MCMIISRYVDKRKEEWNDYVYSSKNGVFLFDRNYMDYHKDRFMDHSLIIENEKGIVALMPANETDGILWSHAGLTYGGLLIDETKKQKTVMDCFELLVSYAKKNQFRKILYKPVPHIFHKQPAEEDLFALKYFGAQLKEVSASTVINLQRSIKMGKSRRSQVKRAVREGVSICELSEKKHYVEFMRLQEEVLKSKHKTRATHSPDEIFMLHDRFPDNIKLYAAIHFEEIIAGAVVFINERVVHTQYLAASETARIIGGLDLVIDQVIETFQRDKQWLDFGISTEKGGLYLNEGLIWQKESFGGRTNIYELWELEIG